MTAWGQGFHGDWPQQCFQGAWLGRELLQGQGWDLAEVAAWSGDEAELQSAAGPPLLKACGQQIATLPQLQTMLLLPQDPSTGAAPHPAARPASTAGAALHRNPGPTLLQSHHCQGLHRNQWQRYRQGLLGHGVCHRPGWTLPTPGLTTLIKQKVLPTLKPVPYDDQEVSSPSSL